MLLGQQLSLSDWASVATVATGLSAFLALIFAIWQTRQVRQSQLEAVARDHYQHFLELCIQYPVYAPPGPNLDMDALTFDGDPLKFTQYEWFFTAGNNALEAIFLSVGEQSTWKETIASILIEHLAYVTSPRYDEIFRSTVDPKYQRFIDIRFPKIQQVGVMSASTVPMAAE